MSLVIVCNQIKCNKCGDTPFSRNRHDFRYCKCGAVAVDGGQEYLRRVGEIEDWEEISIHMPRKTVDLCVKYAFKAEEQNSNLLGIVYAVFRAMRDIDMKTENK
jgi:hypothetical protein